MARNEENIEYLQLIQVEPEERIITINPKHFAKVDFYEDEEDVNDTSWWGETIKFREPR